MALMSEMVRCSILRFRRAKSCGSSRYLLVQSKSQFISLAGLEATGKTAYELYLNGRFKRFNRLEQK